MKTQEDYIRGLVETRRACDQYASSLTTYSKDDDDDDDDSTRKLMSVQMDAPAPRSYMR